MNNSDKILEEYKIWIQERIEKLNKQLNNNYMDIQKYNSIVSKINETNSCLFRLLQLENKYKD